MNALVAPDPARWNTPLDFLRDLGAYDTLRSLEVAFVLGILTWVPRLKIDRNTRLYCLWFLAISLIVLVVPLRFNQFSMWRTFFEPLPGFGVIRDPKRIIYLYELAFVLATGLFLTRLPGKSLLRTSVSVLVLVFLVSDWNRDVFDASRASSVYDRWVGRSIDIDPSCRSFFVKRASAEYTSRSEHMWTLYSIDALFISLNHSIPSLNGYSAWTPDGWNLFNPQEAEYTERVKRWIERQQLTGVCELDLDARTMRPFSTL